MPITVQQQSQRENQMVFPKKVTRNGSQRMVLGDIRNRVVNCQPVQVAKKDVTAEIVKPDPEKVVKKKLPRQRLCPIVPIKESPVPMEVTDAPSAYSCRVLPSDIEDVDSADADNPQLVSEYVKDIYRYMRILEQKYKVRPLHLSDQKEITSKMRSILIDWLVQVHQRFHLLQETLYLTVDILDRFLQEQKIARSNLQLVGVTAMLIASKYEEMYAPEVRDFIYITDNAYKRDDILKMEQLMLKVLKFNLGKPLPLHFLRRNSKVGNVDGSVHTMAKYLTELTLTEYDFASIYPSQLAGAALCLSLKVLDEGNWSEKLAFYSSYSEAELKPVMSKICKVLLNPSPKLQAIRSKYASQKFIKVSTLPELSSPIVSELASYEEKV